MLKYEVSIETSLEKSFSYPLRVYLATLHVHGVVENNRLKFCPYKYLSRISKVFLNNVNSFRYTFGQHHNKSYTFL